MLKSIFPARTNKAEPEDTQELPDLDALAARLMAFGRDKIMLSLPFLSRAFFRMPMVGGDLTASFGTNGDTVWYNDRFLIRRTKKDRNYPSHAFLHMILHCIYQHPFRIDDRTRDLTFWDTACDIAVENSILKLKLPSVSLESDSDLTLFLSNFEREVHPLTAWKIYHWLEKNPQRFGEIASKWELFTIDDHKFWTRGREENKGQELDCQSTHRGTNLIGDIGCHEADQDPEASEEAEEGLLGRRRTEWSDISDLAQTDLKAYTADADSNFGAVAVNIEAARRDHFNYSDFLEKFKVLGEEMHIDEDSFDYIYYTYGLDHYGNMPLIEPLEYRETDRIRDFVIAIDTSGSCQGAVVEHFLRRTYSILKSSDNFFETVNIHIIQCDAKVQEDTVITKDSDLDDYLQNIELHGFGGTDFRPVFEYVDKLVARRAFTNLKGLVYFTDGNGTYPSKPPTYKTAFVFLDAGDNVDERKVPAWAVTAHLYDTDLSEEDNR